MEERKILIDIDEVIEGREDSRILENLLTLIVDRAELSWDKEKLKISKDEKIFDYLELVCPDRIKDRLKELQRNEEKENG